MAAEHMMTPKTVRHWRCPLGVWAYLCAVAIGAASAAMAAVVSEAVFDPLAGKGGVWGG
jgi:hypothetical protein